MHWPQALPDWLGQLGHPPNLGSRSFQALSACLPPTPQPLLPAQTKVGSQA